MKEKYPYFRVTKWGTRKNLLPVYTRFEQQNKPSPAALVMVPDRPGSMRYSVWRIGQELVCDAKMKSRPNTEPLPKGGKIVHECHGFSEQIGGGNDAKRITDL